MTSCKACVTLVTVVCALFVDYAHAQLGNCHKIDACSCVYDDGTIVKLESLSRPDGKPNFSNVTDARGDLYSWNPCTAFSYPSNDSECQNVAVCMIRQGIPRELFYDLGSQDSAEFKVDNGTLSLTYTADKGDFKRSTVITLQCMANSKFDFFVASGEQDPTNNTVIYTLTLASKWACAYAPNINPALPNTDDGLGAGYIILILIICLISAYVIFGMAYQGLVKKESGARLCPNHEFWCSLPIIRGSSQGRKTATDDHLTTEGSPKYESI